MKKVFSSPDLWTITQLKDVLEESGIACTVRNEVSASIAGEIPINESTPQLWVLEDRDLARALEIKKELQSPVVVSGSAWKCPDCGESSEPQFSSCWKCGAAKT